MLPDQLASLLAGLTACLIASDFLQQLQPRQVLKQADLAAVQSEQFRALATGPRRFALGYYLERVALYNC